MTNAIYDAARYRFAIAALDWRAANTLLVAWSGVPDFLPGDTTVAAIKGRGNVELGRSLAILAKTVAAAGNLQTGNVVIPAIAAGPTITWFTMCLEQVAPDNAIPLLFVDDAENLPFACNGIDVTVQPDWAESRGWGRL